MAQQQEVAFEDWEAEIDEDQSLLVNNQGHINQSKISVEQTTAIAQDKGLQSSLGIIEKLRNFTDKEFEVQCKNTSTTDRVIGESPALLKTEKQFIELSTIVANRLKTQAQTEADKTVPENSIVIFFQEMLLYLYPKYDWQNLEYAKEKLKIVKKDRKEDEARARKLKEKEERLKRGQKKSEQEFSRDKIQEREVESKQEGHQQEQYM